jgi:hypothetical protein
MPGKTRELIDRFVADLAHALTGAISSPTTLAC